MRQPLRLVARLVLATSIAALLALGPHAYSEPAANEPPDNDSSLPLEELRTFAEIFGRIKANYVEQVDDRELLENAIRGMLGGLDPHSTYLDAEDYNELQVGTRGEFGGLGIEVGMEDGFVKIISPIDDTPAQRAGLKSGDLIIRLDDKPVKGMSLSDAVKLMRGKPGSEISLTVVRGDRDKPFKVTLIRDVIRVASVKGRVLEDGFIYIRISNFQAHTTDDLLKKIHRLKRDAGGTIKGMVLDLRNNPGGVLNTAVSVSDAFLEQGVIVYTEGRVEDSKLEFSAAPDDVLNGAPIVVLVNEGSASASEIVAGALQDHKRAVIMGRRTFGKGSVQTIIPINNTTAVKLTTARYFTPAGRSIQAEGIEPDIPLEALKVSAADGPKVKALKEADLVRHLENGSGEPGEDTDGAKDEGAEEDALLSTTDYELYQALNLLKGLYLLQQGTAS